MPVQIKMNADWLSAGKMSFTPRVSTPLTPLANGAGLFHLKKTPGLWLPSAKNGLHVGCRKKNLGRKQQWCTTCTCTREWLQYIVQTVCDTSFFKDLNFYARDWCVVHGTIELWRTSVLGDSIYAPMFVNCGNLEIASNCWFKLCCFRTLSSCQQNSKFCLHSSFTCPTAPAAFAIICLAGWMPFANMNGGFSRCMNV